jgi:cell wall-associated NlpC family hydrolase
MSNWVGSESARHLVALRSGAAAAFAGVAIAAALAGCGTTSTATKSHAAGPRVGLANGGAGGVAPVPEAPDPEAAQSFPEASNAPAHALARAPSQAPAARATTVAPGAPSDAEVRAELRQLEQFQRAARAGTPRPGSIGADGAVVAPPGTPLAIARVIGGGNAIATFPYRFGGGHGSFIDDAYDCSGSVSYALAAAGMLSAPLTSGELEQWGVPGPGRWLTVYANAGHTYMYVGGLRFDTSFRDGPFGSRWQPSVRTNAGFVARHWPGL